MSLFIQKQGLLDTIQDHGRFGYSDMGINPGGAMDSLALSIANALTGNRLDDAAIEMHFPAPVIEFKEDCLISITGADFDPVIINPQTNEEFPVAIWKPVLLKAGTLLKFRKKIWGARAYLSVSGGLDIPHWLNSHSTNMVAGAGGFQGRALKAGDIIPVRKKDVAIPFSTANKNFPFKKKGDIIPGLTNPGNPAHESFVYSLPWSVDYHSFYSEEYIGVIAGPEWDWLDEDNMESIFHQPFQIGSNSNRMGYRLTGPGLNAKLQQSLISSAVGKGTLQLLPDGNIILLMADHQTTGGYPRIGNICAVSLPLLAQKSAGEHIRFKQINMEEALEQLILRRKETETIELACKLNWKKWREKYVES